MKYDNIYNYDNNLENDNLDCHEEFFYNGLTEN